TFVFEPIRWNARYGWRPMCEQERLAMFYFWREVGRRMNIRQLPEAYDEFQRYNTEYEKRHYRYTDANQRVGGSTRDLFLSWFPGLLHPLARPAIYALMDEPLIEAFGFPRASPLMRRLVTGALRARAKVLRWLPPRTQPRLRTNMKH